MREEEKPRPKEGRKGKGGKQRQRVRQVLETESQRGECDMKETDRLSKEKPREKSGEIKSSLYPWPLHAASRYQL